MLLLLLTVLATSAEDRATIVLIWPDQRSTVLDYSLGEEAAVDCEREIREATAKTQKEEGQIAVGDCDRDNEFSVSPCACCGARLAGQRHHCVILSGRKD